MAELSLSGVSKRFGDTVAVDSLDLTVEDGEFVILLGPTGAGKTTTLRLVSGLERSDTGRIYIGGHDMTAAQPAQRNVTFVFQQYSLYPHLSAYDNLAFPLRAPAYRLPEPEIRRRVDSIADMLHISDKLANKVTKLSGGEMQRVAIGRALVRDPQIYLMDEPLSSLDAKLRGELRLELKRIKKDLGATILYVTHDQIEAMTMADRIGVLRQGKLVQIGTPRQIYEDPQDIYVATRLGQPAINLIPPDLLAGRDMPAGVRTVGARTEHLRIAQARNGDARGRIEWVEHLGDQNHLHVIVGKTRITVLAQPENALRVGDEVTIELERPLYFDDAGARIRR